MDDPPSAPRRGLGFFPPAVVIHSGPPRSLRGYTDTNESAGLSRSDTTTAAVDSGYTGPPLPSRSGREAYEIWKDWNINPGGHGGRRGPPVFVPPSGSYDELGRSVGDGFGVAVDHGEGETQDEEKKMAGGEVADWYRSLSLRPSANASAQASGSSTPVTQANDATAVRESEDTPVTAGSTSVPLPSPPPLPEPSNQDLPRSKTASSASSPSASAPTPTPSSTVTPVRVNRSEWFIRRALLSRAGQESQRPSPAPAQPSSIGAMLNLDTVRSAPAPRRYALGPDNAGYARLEALGWGGGGLGRPEGWERDVREPPRKRRRDTEVEVVDLTADSDSEMDTDQDTQPAVTAKAAHRATEVSTTSSSGVGRRAQKPADVSVPASPDSDDERDGPGRTMPVATALKLDRLGLGRAAHVKKVTHSAAEIAAAQRRAKGKRDKRGGEMGKREKIKWADREKRDRDARRRIQQALNA